MPVNDTILHFDIAYSRIFSIDITTYNLSGLMASYATNPFAYGEDSSSYGGKLSLL